MASQSPSRFRLGRGGELDLTRPQLVGILNITPDSFSDGGRYTDRPTFDRQVERLLAEGAAMLDLGAESTRPDAVPITADVEQARLEWAVERLRVLAPDGLWSVDTRHASTANWALERGAVAVNDVSGGRLGAVAAAAGAGWIAMHTPKAGLHAPDEAEAKRPVEAVRDFVERCRAVATVHGLDPDQWVVDPGLGFGKDTDANLTLVASLAELVGLGQPLLLGASRKRFLGVVTGVADPTDRDQATAAVCAIAAAEGVVLFRVHDVSAVRDAVAVGAAIYRARRFDDRDEPKA